MYNYEDSAEIIDFYTYFGVGLDITIDEIQKVISREAKFWNNLSEEFNIFKSYRGDKLDLLNYARTVFSNETARSEYDKYLEMYYKKNNETFQDRTEEYVRFYHAIVNLPLAELVEFHGLLQQQPTIYNMDNPDWIYFSFFVHHFSKEYHEACLYAGRLLFLKKPTEHAIIIGMINCLNYIKNNQSFTGRHSEKVYYNINPNPVIVLDRLFDIVKNNPLEYGAMFCIELSSILVDTVVDINNEAILLRYIQLIKEINMILSSLGILTNQDTGNAEFLNNKYKFGMIILKKTAELLRSNQVNLNNNQTRQHISNTVNQAIILITPLEKMTNVEDHKSLIRTINHELEQYGGTVKNSHLNIPSDNSAITEYQDRQKWAAGFVILLLIAVPVIYFLTKSDNHTKNSSTSNPGSVGKPTETPRTNLIVAKTIPENEVQNIARLTEIGNDRIVSVEASGFFTSKSGIIYSPENIIDDNYDSWWTPSPQRDGTNSSLTIKFLKVEKLYGISIYPGSGRRNGKQLWNDNNVLSQFRLEVYHPSIQGKITLFVELNDLEKPSQKKIYFTPIDAKMITLYPVSWKNGKKWNDLCISHFKPLIDKSM